MPCPPYSQSLGNVAPFRGCPSRGVQTREKGKLDLGLVNSAANALMCVVYLISQIQFKEKVLWTAITLFIFLVCCQVSAGSLAILFEIGQMIVCCVRVFVLLDSSLWDHVLRQCRPLLLDACHYGFQQRWVDGRECGLYVSAFSFLHTHLLSFSHLLTLNAHARATLTQSLHLH